jgi:hypothetical protein
VDMHAVTTVAVAPVLVRDRMQQCCTREKVAWDLRQQQHPSSDVNGKRGSLHGVDQHRHASYACAGGETKAVTDRITVLERACPQLATNPEREAEAA